MLVGMLKGFVIGSGPWSVDMVQCDVPLGAKGFDGENQGGLTGCGF